MKLLYFAMLVILLATSLALASSKEIEPWSKTGDEGYEYDKEILRQQQVKPGVNLLTDSWPDQGSFDDNSLNNEAPQLPHLNKAPYNSYQKKISLAKYQQRLYKIPDGSVQKQIERFPILFGAKMGSELSRGSGSNSDNYNDIGEEREEVSDSSLNQIVDFLLDLVNKEIVAKGKDQIPVPNMSEEFWKRVAFLKLHGKFDAQNGWFKNLSTIQRTGDVVATRQGTDMLVITVEVGLATMQFGFESYQANLAGLSVRGHMTGSVASNSVTVQVAVSIVGEQCNASLERLTLDRFDGISVDLTGLGDLSWLLDNIAGWATQHFKDDIVSSIESNLSKAVTDVLAKLHCSEFVSMMINYPGGGTRPDVPVVPV